MLKLISFIALFFILSSCKNVNSTPKGEDAKKWLIESIESYFKTDKPSNSIFTKKYTSFKNDALALAYDGGITEEEFTNKWTKKFNLDFAGIGVGFFISTQDWGEIKVVKCNLINEKSNKDKFVFDVVIKDVSFKTSYLREIHVISNENSFLIADILEFD